MAIANIKVKLTPDGSAIDAELNKLAKRSPAVIVPELEKQAKQVIQINQQTNQKLLTIDKQFAADKLKVQQTSTKLLTKQVQDNGQEILRLRRKLDADLTAEQRKQFQSELKGYQQQNALIRSELTKRPDVQRGGAGVGAGILGTGRNLISAGGLNIPTSGAAAAAAGVVIFKKAADEGEKLAQIQDDLVAGFQRTGQSIDKATQSAKVAAEGAKVLGERYAIDDDEISQATAAYLRYGGTADDIAKKQLAIIGISERLKISYEEAGEKLARSIDPEVRGELAKQNIIIGESADEHERLNIILKATEGTRAGLIDKTKTELGQYKQGKIALQNSLESYEKLAFSLLSAFAPALKIAAKALDFVAEHGEAFASVILSIISPVTLLAKVIYDNFAKIKEYVTIAIDGIVSVYEAAERTLNKVTLGALGKSAEQQQVAKDREASNNKLAESTKKINSVVNDNTQVMANNNAVLAEWNKNHKDTYVDLDKAAKAQADATTKAKAEAQKIYEALKAQAEAKKDAEIKIAELTIKNETELALQKIIIEKKYLSEELVLAKKNADLKAQYEIEAKQKSLDAQLILKPKAPSRERRQENIGLAGEPLLDENGDVNKIGNKPNVGGIVRGRKQTLTDVLNDNLEQYKQYGQNVADVFTQYIFNPVSELAQRIGGVFGEVFGAIAKQIESIAGQLLASGLVNLLLTIFGGGTGGFFGGIISAFKGLFGGGKASGGTLQRGKFYVTGERGAEIIDYTKGTPNVIPLSRGGQYQTASRFGRIGGQDAQSLRIGGFIGARDSGSGTGSLAASAFQNIGGQDPQSLRIGGFIGIIMKQQADFMSGVAEMISRVSAPQIMPVVVNSHAVTNSQNQSTSVRAVSYLGG